MTRRLGLGILVVVRLVVQVGRKRRLFIVEEVVYAEP